MNVRHLLSLVWVVAFATAAVSGQAARPASQQFELAIAWSNGNLTPFAAYDQGQWTRAWPEPADDSINYKKPSDVPSVWLTRGVDVPTMWRLWPTSSGQATDAVVTGLEHVAAACEKQVELTTGIPTAPDVNVLGVATHGEVVITRIQEFKRQSARWRAAESLVVGKLQQHDSRHRNAGLRSLYAATAQLSSPMYFSAGTKQTGPPNVKSPAHPVMSGWLFPTKSGGFRMEGVRSVLTDAFETDVDHLEPLGRISVDGRSFWIARNVGYEGDAYHILEVGAGTVKVVLEMHGGGC